MMQGEVQLQPQPPNSQKLNDSATLLANHTNSSSSSASNCDEIKTVDLENDASSSPCCRICLDEDSELERDELISPCMCKGTQQFVHRSCLDYWRSINVGFGFSHCTTCKAQFHLRVETFDDDNNCWRLKAKFRLFVARHVVLVFFLVQTVIAAMAGFAYMMDKDGKFRNSFNGVWDRILSKHPIPFFYYCIGAVAFFVLTGIVGIFLHCASLNSGNDPRMAGCRNCCYGPPSMKEILFFVYIFVIIVVFLGLACVFLAATMAILRIWQRHYHILAKRELTKKYIVEDLHGSYTPPKLDAVHEVTLKTVELL